MPLASAREKAREARLLVENGIDPILMRQQAKSSLKAQRAAAKTVTECAQDELTRRAPRVEPETPATVDQYARDLRDASPRPDVGRRHWP